MNPVFAASCSMGRSTIYAGDNKEKEARSALTQAATHFGRAGLRDAQRVAQDLAANWSHHAGRIGDGFHKQIQPELAKKDLKSYYAASAGWCLGLAERGCSLMTKHKDSAEAKKAIDKWLTVARDETDALRTQKLVPGMKNFTADFKNCLGCIHAVTDPTQWKHLCDCGSLIENLANQVGNAIP